MTNVTTTHTYLAALVDGGGTVPPELGAVRRLVERGHDVTVLAEDSMKAEVEASGATFRPWVEAPNRPDRLPENDPYRDWEVKSPTQLFDRLLETQFVGPAARYLADINTAVAERRPDAILCSQFAFGAMIAAEAAGIPFAVLMPNIYMLPTDGIPPFGLGLPLARGPLGRLRDRAIGAFTLRVWNRKGLPRVNALRAEVGLEPLATFWDQVHRADRELVMTARAFDFPAPARPAAVRYVGPVLDDPSWSEPWTAPPATTRSSWSACRRRSRTRSAACSGSSTPSGRSPCARSSRPAPRSTHRCCRRRRTCRSSHQRRTAKSSSRPRWP